MLTWMRVLWPSFLIAGAAEGAFFSLFDPMDMAFFGEPVTLSRTAVYSIGFFLFWGFAAASSGLTSFLQRGADEVNRCPMAETERPPGCPKRGEPGGQPQA